MRLAVAKYTRKDAASYSAVAAPSSLGCYASSSAVSAGRHSRRTPAAACPANRHPRYVHAGAAILTVATAVGADDFPGCCHGRWRRGRHAARE